MNKTADKLIKLQAKFENKQLDDKETKQRDDLIAELMSQEKDLKEAVDKWHALESENAGGIGCVGVLVSFAMLAFFGLNFWLSGNSKASNHEFVYPNLEDLRNAKLRTSRNNLVKGMLDEKLVYYWKQITNLITALSCLSQNRYQGAENTSVEANHMDHNCGGADCVHHLCVHDHQPCRG